VNEETPARGPALGIFAAVALPGDAEHPRILSNAGTLFASAGARLVCLAEDGTYCRPLVVAARAARGEVTILSDGSLDSHTFATGCVVEIIPEAETRIQRMSELADALVGFPVGLIGVRAMFNVWATAGGGSSGKPVALLNRNRAFEVLRGYAMDVLSHSLTNTDQLVLFADTIEDLWTKLQRALAKG
jgi:hypothetical protein